MAAAALPSRQPSSLRGAGFASRPSAVTGASARLLGAALTRKTSLRGGRPHKKKVDLAVDTQLNLVCGPAEASIITMVEAQAAESSRKRGFVCRTHASTRTVLARRMGPGGAGAVRGRTESSPQDSNPNSWEIAPATKGAGGWCLLRSRGEGSRGSPGSLRWRFPGAGEGPSNHLFKPVR